MKNGSGCIVLMILLILNALPGGVATEYLVEFWTRYFGQPVDIPFWAAAIAGIFVAEFTIPAAILTWIVSLFM